MFNLRIAIRIFIFLLITQGSLCLRNVHVVVPEAVERGSKVEMKCIYDLEQEVLYSVKWYRGDREFCRYSPRDVPPLKIFRIPGIEVDREGSDAEKITIQAATQTASGRYTCEVSADAPSFQTAQVHTHMYVVVLPKSGPSMHGLKRRYRPGMKLKVECISRHSLPAANLSFFINNDAALSQHVLHRVDGETVGGPMTAYSTIQFVVQKHHFVRGKIKIRCTASVYSIYLQSLEKSAEEERIRTTSASFPEVHEAVVYSIHRLPESRPPNHLRISRKRPILLRPYLTITLRRITQLLLNHLLQKTVSRPTQTTRMILKFPHKYCGSNISGSTSTTVKMILLLIYLLPNVLR